MADISSVIMAKTDQINAADLMGKSIVVTFGEVILRGGDEQPVSIRLVGNDKFYRPCKSMCRVLAKGWTNETANWTGKSVRLYCDPKIKFGPLEVGGVRISHMSDIDGDMLVALQVRKGTKAGFLVKPLIADRPATKPDRAADGVKTWLARIADGEDVTTDDGYENRVAWLRENRPELAAELDAAMTQRQPADDSNPFGDADEGRSDAQHGESHNATDDPLIEPSELLRLINTKLKWQDVNELVTSHTASITSYSEDDRARIAEAQEARIKLIKGAK